MIAVVRDFLRSSNTKQKPKAASWFTDISRAVLNTDVWAWLSFVTPQDTEDLRVELKAIRDHGTKPTPDRNRVHRAENSKDPDLTQSP